MNVDQEINQLKFRMSAVEEVVAALAKVCDRADDLRKELDRRRGDAIGAAPKQLLDDLRKQIDQILGTS